EAPPGRGDGEPGDHRDVLRTAAGDPVSQRDRVVEREPWCPVRFRPPGRRVPVGLPWPDLFVTLLIREYVALLIREAPVGANLLGAQLPVGGAGALGEIRNLAQERRTRRHRVAWRGVRNGDLN